MSRSRRTTSGVCTGFDITDALRKYLEDGHNKVLRPVSESDPGIDEVPDDFDPELAELTDRASAVVACREHFCRVRKNAPAGDRKLLEIPYMSENRFPESGWQPRLFIPTLAGSLKAPSENDLKAIQFFIDCANRLLPDHDAARERAGFKLEDLQYEVRPTRTLTLPLYDRSEGEELLPPHFLQMLRKKAAR